MGRPVPTETLFWSLQPLERPVPTETLFWALQPLESLHSPGGRPASQPFLPASLCIFRLHASPFCLHSPGGRLHSPGGRPASQPARQPFLPLFSGRTAVRPENGGKKGLAGRPSARPEKKGWRANEWRQKGLAGWPSARRMEAFQRLQSPEKCLSRNRPFQRLQRPEKCLSRNRPSQRLRDLNYET